MTRRLPRQTGEPVTPPTTGPMVRPQSGVLPIPELGPVGFLASPMLGRPYALRQSAVTLIGRDRTNHVVLPVQHVSRFHATIAWKDGAYVLSDRGSLNGTQVNGVAVASRVLEEGDVIGIGPFEFAFRLSLDGKLENPIFETTHFGVETDGFSGHVAGVSLPEVWQLIEMTGKSGVLSIEAASHRGRVYFDEGRAVHAEVGAIDGTSAALFLVAGATQKFRFEAGTLALQRRSIERPKGWLLLEAAKMEDEAASRRAG